MTTARQVDLLRYNLSRMGKELPKRVVGEGRVESGIAYIETVGTDQGTAGSWCSGCGVNFTEQFVMQVVDKQRTCPNDDCGKVLKWGGIYTPSGGSDF